MEDHVVENDEGRPKTQTAIDGKGVYEDDVFGHGKTERVESLS